MTSTAPRTRITRTARKTHKPRMSMELAQKIAHDLNNQQSTLATVKTYVTNGRERITVNVIHSNGIRPYTIS